ncbi:MAG: cyclic nucleotide-binding domain-containing protein [Sorangiineae bacterium]|nr:cyclic nucleotide-binding domain-containing protein [Polyangiaceae bacterium]MEB2322867.1 cyclic nucleotide-binding domain-containing protein [Sorangiineae bacterium]
MSSPASGPDNPFDRALSLALSGDDQAALRWATALVTREPARPVALLIAARLLGARGRVENAKAGLAASAGRALDAGNLPLAVAACRLLEQLGEDAARELDAIAATFAAGSPRLLAAGARPPKLPEGAGGGLTPLDGSLSVEALLDACEAAVRGAAAAYASEVKVRGEAPKVAPEPLFSSLGEAGLRAMIGIFDTQLVAAGEVVIEQGTTGAEAFIVARGELEVKRELPGEEPVLLARVGGGTLIGEMSLLSRSPRAASVTAVRPSLLLVARKESLDAVVAEAPEVGREFAGYCRRRMMENLVRTSALLRAVKPRERPALFERFETRTFEEGDKLITQGQDSDGLHLVASGEVAVVVNEGGEGTVVTTLGAGEVVGEVALVLRRPSNADVVAVHPTVTLHLPRDRFLEIVKQHPALLAELYELAVKRAEETSSIVAQEATDADDFVLL